MEPLGLPKGSVRAILALFSVVAIVTAYVVSIFTGFSFPGELLAIAGLILGYYFGSREKI